MKKTLIGLASFAGVLCVSADPISPAGTAAGNVAAIQAAIDVAAVANPAGTVTLGNGLFEIDAQLMVTGGVTLVGQGWNNTIIKQVATTATSDTRCATIDGGARIEGVTLTGGQVRGANWKFGGGVQVLDGTVSWCSITNNLVDEANCNYGGGVFIKKGKIDHSIIADNQVVSRTSTENIGGGICIRESAGTVTIDTCLIAGNRSYNNQHTGQGGGIGVSTLSHTLTIRNTTITGNESGNEGGSSASVGGAIYTSGDSKNYLSMVNCIIAGNASANTNITVKLSSSGGVDYCLFDISDDKVGEHSKVGDPAFVDGINGDYHLLGSSPAVGAGVRYEGLVKDLDNVVFAEIPSMGCYESGDLAATPVFDPASGTVFYPTINVTLTCETAGATIHYTTDGSIPTESNTAYSGPIEISATTTIKARAYKSGIGASGVAVATYTCKRPTPPLSSFKKYVEITLSTNLASTAIANAIPALIKLSESTITGFDYDDFSLAKGGDMMFVDESGAVLPHEVDTWDTDGESLVWVRLPSTAANTKIVLYYGNGAISSEESTDVWTDYVGVWHFNEATGATVANSYGTYANSTATLGIDGNVAQYAITNETGRFGKCFRTNDSSGYKGGNYNYGGVWVNDSGSNSPIDGGQNFTISGWFKHGNFQYCWDHIFYKREKSDNTTDKSQYKDAFAIECNAGSGTTPNPFARGSSNTGGHKGLPNNLVDQWGYLTFVYEGGVCRLYENGGSLSWVTITACIDNDSPLVFGNNCNVAAGLVGDAAWNGWIDEVRFSSGSKSADWVAAEYAAMNVGETDIFTYGDAKSTKARSGVIIIVE